MPHKPSDKIVGKLKGDAMSISIFGKETTMTTAEIVANNFDVVYDEESGEICVKIAFNKGKGTGAQLVPVDEYRDYVSAIGELATAGIPEAEEDNWTAAETVSRTARMDSDGRVCFRVKGGKGAKPAKIPSSELGDIHALLDSVADRVDAAAESMRSQLDSVSGESDFS